MSRSTPADVAISFRSLARRRAEALGDANPATVSALMRQLDAEIASAAALLGVDPDAAAVAGAIESRPNENWDDDTLDALRRHALDAGGILRRITEAVAADDGNDGNNDDDD